MTIQQALVIDNEYMFVASYTIDIIDCAANEEDQVEPFLLAMAKTPGASLDVTIRNQLNRIPITVFK